MPEAYGTYEKRKEIARNNLSEKSNVTELHDVATKLQLSVLILTRVQQNCNRILRISQKRTPHGEKRTPCGVRMTGTLS